MIKPPYCTRFFSWRKLLQGSWLDFDQKSVVRCSATSSAESKQQLESKYEDLPGPSGSWVNQLSQSEKRHLLRVREEYHLARYVDDWVPDTLSELDWEKLMEFKSTDGRMRYLFFVSEKQRAKEKQRMEKEIRAQHRAREKEEITERIQSTDHLIYNLSQNCIFHRFNHVYMSKSYEANVAHGMLFGPKIVVDLDWFYPLNPSARGLTLSQLQTMYNLNKTHVAPADLIMTGWRPDPKFEREFGKHLQFLDPSLSIDSSDKLGIRTSEQSLVDLFPRKDIIYLSPDAKYELPDRLDSDKVYVIAGLVDKKGEGRTHANATLGKAKRLGIEARKLPLDRYVKWYKGGKSITLNQVLGMLLDVLALGSWEDAIRKWVPKRKLEPSNHEELAAARGKYFRNKTESLTAAVSGRAAL